MSQRALMQMAKSGLGQEATRVALALLSLVDYENFVSVSQAELGRELGLRPQNVNRAFARLLAEGFLLPGPKLAGRGTYALNPSYGWKGSAKGHHAAMAARIKSAGLSVVQGGGEAP
jgi:DNA-binding IclR family transcriptional regulator